MKSERTIDDEIEKLKAMKPKVLRYSAFGDDNHHAIDVQIDALERRMTALDVDRTYPDDEQVDDHTSALSASDWMTERENEVPSQDWLPLVKD